MIQFLIMIALFSRPTIASTSQNQEESYAIRQDFEWMREYYNNHPQSINQVDAEGKTSLIRYLAHRQQNPEFTLQICKFLLQKGANPNHEIIKKSTCKCTCACHECLCCNFNKRCLFPSPEYCSDHCCFKPSELLEYIHPLLIVLQGPKNGKFLELLFLFNSKIPKLATKAEKTILQTAEQDAKQKQKWKTTTILSLRKREIVDDIIAIIMNFTPNPYKMGKNYIPCHLNPKNEPFMS